MGLQVLALACLVGAIILGFVRKMNVGIVCFGLHIAGRGIPLKVLFLQVV